MFIATIEAWDIFGCFTHYDFRIKPCQIYDHSTLTQHTQPVHTLTFFTSIIPFGYLTYTHTPKSLQCLRLTAIPNQNARHDPCPGTDLAKPLSPLETLALTSLGQTIIVLFVFDRIPSERRFPTGLFSWALLTPTNKNAKQALFLVCILQDGF